ncbi:MAG: nickel pincer cofactor biosynthesis protein LarB [Candidatus Omnitrophica bacterium]|nr:nickel pincer cofactor biosynthesis protein LarB [Candidatus Omnitrophota bacterium]
MIYTVPRVQRMLQDLRQRRRSVAQVMQELRQLPVDDVGFAKLDTHRGLRRGLPEAIYCNGKTLEQLSILIDRLGRVADPVLLTRLTAARYAQLGRRHPRLRYAAEARLGYLTLRRRRPLRRGRVVVVTGGTADGPVAEEAAATLEILGHRVTRLLDVGVAGVHRVLAHQRALQGARVVIVVAGMEGALASVVAGLTAAPIVAVPTSVGYGASFRGIAPLLTMLNSCAPGVGVVNIDNGFGAAYLAHLIRR